MSSCFVGVVWYCDVLSEIAVVCSGLPVPVGVLLCDVWCYGNVVQ